MNNRQSPFLRTHWLVAAAALGAVATSAGSAAALGISASVRGLYGFALGDSQQVQVNGSNGSESSDWSPYHTGLGLRAGVTLSALYLGASLDYFLAETTHVSGIEVSGGRLQFMGNLGYEFGLPLLKLRPFLGVGYAQTQLDANSGGDASKQELVLAPGGEVLLSLGGLIDLSAELRYNWAPTADAVILGIGAGLSF